MVSEARPPIAEQILGAALKVNNTLGNGFLENVCENALAHCLLLNFGTKRLQIKRLVGETYANEEDVI